MTATTQPCVILMLKAPRAGTVKTRLAASIGSEHALAVYRWLVESQLERLPEDWRLEIHFSPADAIAEMRAWLGPDRAYYPQREGDLGQRLSQAIAGAASRGSKVVACIGGDCPALEPKHFHMTRFALEEGDDVVFGPTDDGGYYLVALKENRPQLFRNIPWSSANTLSASLAAAEDCGAAAQILPQLWDIDDEADLVQAIELGLLPKRLQP